MPHTKASICNSALLLLGQDPLVEDADAAQQYSDADAVVRAYDERFGRVLRSHNWNFAETLAIIDADATAPAFGFARRFPLPTVPPCARVWALSEDRHGKEPKYRVRGGFIETDEPSPLHVIYIARIEDPSLFDDEFAEALAAEIASKAALKVLGSKEAATVFRKEAKEDQTNARSIDSKENPPKDIDGGSWTVGRSTG
jgi:hypothetical protein